MCFYLYISYSLFKLFVLTLCFHYIALVAVYTHRELLVVFYSYKWISY